MSDKQIILANNIKKLYALAEQDTIYLTWKHCAEEARPKYDRILKYLPRKLRYAITNYVDCEVMRIQTVSVIACRNPEALERLPKAILKK